MKISFSPPSLTIIIERHHGRLDLGLEEEKEEVEVPGGEYVGDDEPALEGLESNKSWEKELV